MLMGDLLKAVLPRVGRKIEGSGITIFQAATSIQSVIYKNLLKRKSDLLATNDLSLSIPAFGYAATLPTNFIAVAERPQTQELVDDWMAGTVTAYNNLTGVLSVNVTQFTGTDTLSYWSVALGPVPGTPASNIGNSTTTLTCGAGIQTMTTQAGLNLKVGQYLILSSANSPSGWYGRRHLLQPNYLADDQEDHDQDWWNWYGYYGAWDIPYHRPHTYKIINTTIYIKPKPIVDILLIGKYFQIPVPLITTAQVIPWNSLFDQIFFEGCVWIIVKGVAMPEIDPAFQAFFKREFDTVIDARIDLIPQNRRLHRSNFM